MAFDPSPGGPRLAVPGPTAQVVPTAKRVRALLDGQVLADSTAVLVLRQSGRMPVYAFPRGDVRMERLHALEAADGTARFAAEGAGDDLAAWSYEAPPPGCEALTGHVLLRWGAMDAWYEEDEPVAVHPRDPFVRVDVLQSRRAVRVVLDGEVLAESTRARFLFETGHPVRYYLPPEDVRQALLVPSQTRTRCPYKGEARYWHVRIGERTHNDAVWSYPEPFAELAAIRDYLCCYDERMDAVEVAPPDGSVP